MTTDNLQLHNIQDLRKSSTKYYNTVKFARITNKNKLYNPSKSNASLELEVKKLHNLQDCNIYTYCNIYIIYTYLQYKIAI